MMFKNETLVRWATVLVFVITGSISQAADDGKPDGGPFGGMCDPEKISKLPLDRQSIQFRKCDEGFDKYISSLSGGDGCKDPNGDYKKALAESAAACGPIPGKNVEGGLTCGWAIEQCDCKGPAMSSERATTKACSDIPESDYTPARTTGTHDTGIATQDRFKACPALAAKDLDKIEKDLKDQRAQVRALEKKLPELQEAAEEARSQADEKVADLKKQMADATSEHGKQLNEAKEQMRAAQNQLAQQLVQLEEEITKIDEQRGQIRLTKNEAAIKREEAINQIELNCHATASAQVNKMQTERLELESTRNLNRGGFNMMLKNVGVTDRAQWQRVAKKYYDWCVQSSPTRKSKESANRIYESALKSADQAESNLDKRQADIRRRMHKIKNKEGCGGQTDSDGESSDSAMCQEAKKLQDQARQVEEAYRLKMGGLKEQVGQAQMAGMRKAAAKGQAIQQARLEIMDETNRLNNLEEFLALKRRYAEGASIEGKQYEDARQKYYLLKAAATALVTCKTKAGTEYKCKEDGDCMAAARYLNALGTLPISMDTILSSSKPVTGPPASPNGEQQFNSNPAEGMKER